VQWLCKSVRQEVSFSNGLGSAYWLAQTHLTGLWVIGRRAMMQPHQRRTPVWHALSRDHTVLPATDAFIQEWNEPRAFALTDPGGMKDRVGLS